MKGKAQSNSESRRNALPLRRDENFPEWYQHVVRAANLAEFGAVRGCMTIKPNGYAIWEVMQSTLDAMIKASGHRNAYFPLFIPKSYLEREAEHVDGFAKECAVVTHGKLVRSDGGKLIAAAPLEEQLIVRPTSETIIGEAFSRWIQSHRDLPLLINQWANVVRMEMRPRLFLRTVEFLWQEGHTAHSSAEEAREETLRMLELYRVFAEEHMCVPVTCGLKTTRERFPGALDTYAIEAMMQDGKALQMGTSHFLGQNFAKACSIKYADSDGAEKFAWTTSWGVSTRLIGGLIMAHGDDDGLVLPPPVAPVQIAILPMVRGDGDGAPIKWAETLKIRLEETRLKSGASLRVAVDDRQLRGGEKFWQKVREGIAIIVEVGARELDDGTVTFTLRGSRKVTIGIDKFVASAANILDDYGEELFNRQLRLRLEKTVRVSGFDEMRDFFAAGNGFVEAHFCGDRALEERICAELSIGTRCVPLGTIDDVGPCIADPSRVGPLTIWAKAY
ncbi:MAG: proline--tRNA ligase [Puniceicoccales bacterium]|jgi:prolyl-tRNA synthetase|nr:proline--tRNA ligase [Puniceicoccales bacterium]